MLRASHTGQRLCAVLGTLVLTLVLAGCTGSTSTSTVSSTTERSTNTTTTNGSPQDDQSACAFVAPAQVKANMGVTVGAPTSIVHGSVTTCTYKAPELSKSVIIEYDTSATASSFAADRSTIESHHVSTTSVPGLADQAYSFSEASGQNKVNAVVTLQGSLETIVTGTSSSAQVEALAEEIVDKIDAHNAPTISTTPTTSTTSTTSTRG
jgi:hypothetical protein